MMPRIVTREPPQHGRCHVGVSQSHHVQHVGPTGPKRNLPASVRTPQTKPAMLAMSQLSLETVVCNSCSKQLFTH